MIHRRAVETLGELEQKFPVATWMADGIHFWPLLRVKLGKSILAAARREAREAQPETLPPAGERLSQRLGSARRLVVRGGQRFADRHNTLHRVPRADALFWSRPANRQLLDMGWYKSVN